MPANLKIKGKIIERFGNQFEFSKVVNMHESDISRVIHGRRAIDEETRKFWARVLDADVNELFPEVKNGD